jgi:hypothetical protein
METFRIGDLVKPRAGVVGVVQGTLMVIASIEDGKVVAVEMSTGGDIVGHIKWLERATIDDVREHGRQNLQRLTTPATGADTPELVHAVTTVMSNLEARWRKMNGQGPIQELGISRTSDMLAANYRILEVALRACRPLS